MANGIRVNLYFPVALLEKVDKRAKELNMTRSAFMTMSVSRQLENDELIKNIPQMLETFNSAIAESKRVNK